MATPTILINQAGQSAGTAGQSRTDLVLSSLVTCTDPANTSGTFSWELVVPEGSSATLSGASTDTATFTPDVTGTYLIYLTVDTTKSFNTNAIGEKVSSQGGAAVLDNGVRIPTAGETVQFDSTRGWGPALDAFLRDLTGATGGTQGDVLYVDSNGEVARLAAGTNGQLLTSGGAGADPSWTTASGTGDVTAAANFGTDNRIIRSDGTGKGVQASGITVDDTDNVSGVGTFASGTATITGNIVVTGTVDGRDVATDGTKLDGIEASATADQTDAEIKTAYENNADTNAFTDADHSKLDGIEASADVTDATNVAAAGAVMDSDFSGTYTAHLRRTGSGTYTASKDNFTATTAPGATDDSASDYAIGSLWIDITNQNAYICEDATASSANWLQINGGGTGDFSGPASSTDNALVRFDGTGGKTGQNSGWTLDDSDVLLAGGDLDLNGNRVILDADADTYIEVTTDDRIDFSVGGTDICRINAGGFVPAGTTFDVGTSGNEWRDLYTSGLYVGHLSAVVSTSSTTAQRTLVHQVDSGITLTLHQPASGQDGQHIYVKNVDTMSAATVAAGASDTINGGAANISVPAGSAVQLVWDNSANDWVVISGFHGTF